MSGASMVYASARELFLRPPGKIVYHLRGRHVFPRYVPDPEASERVGYPAAKREGEEHGYTACGRTTYYTETRPDLASQRNRDGYTTHSPMKGIRLDHAVLLGRPCGPCHRGQA